MRSGLPTLEEIAGKLTKLKIDYSRAVDGLRDSTRLEALMFSILLSIPVFISAILHLRAEHSGNRRQTYIFKPLTLLLIILIALLAKNPVSGAYRWLIVAGLFCSLAGDIFLMLPSDRFIMGLVSFLLAHLCYIAAFAIDGAPKPLSLLLALPLLFYAFVMMRILWPHLGSMRMAVVVYMLVIMLMAWQALNRWTASAQGGSGLALSGALLFVASDSVLAVNRFKGRLPHAQALIMSTYFAAQLLIALSI